MAVDALESAEDYLERILMLQESGMKEIRAVDLANSFGYSKASISIALRKLEEKGYVALGLKNQLYLTPTGYDIAEKVYEKHNVLGTWLLSIGVSEETSFRDGCRMEHILSQESFDALKKYLEDHHKKKQKHKHF